MNGGAQKWPECDPVLRTYAENFVSLLRELLGENLTGVYLHGSLAMGGFYAPKSDIDIIAVVREKLSPALAETIAKAVARYSAERPITGDIEFSIITADSAANPPYPAPYELHYSSSWRERILNGEVDYENEAFDPDLAAHLTVLKKRGHCLYGKAVDEVFGNVAWQDFMASVTDDLNWILEQKNILESPFYGILNICRMLQLQSTGEQYTYTKEEGGEWALTHLPPEFKPLIQQALEIYRADTPVNEAQRPTGGAHWNREALLAFRDYARNVRGL